MEEYISGIPMINIADTPSRTELSNIEVLKNTKDIFTRRYSLTDKQKNIFNKFNISEKDINNKRS